MTFRKQNQNFNANSVTNALLRLIKLYILELVLDSVNKMNAEKSIEKNERSNKTREKDFEKVREQEKI